MVIELEHQLGTFTSLEWFMVGRTGQDEYSTLAATGERNFKPQYLSSSLLP
jgi:hypothetical protein